MSQSHKKLAIAVCSKILSYMQTERRNSLDDAILKDTFHALPDAKSIEVELVDWKDETVNFRQFDAILVTSTWDLHKASDQFMQWLDYCEGDGKKRLINDIEVLKLGVKKHAYLQLLINKFGQDESSAGCIIPTFFVNVDEKTQTQASFSTLINMLKKMNPNVWSHDIVIKPNTSADGENTFIVTHDEKKAKSNPLNYRLFKEMDTTFEEMKSNEKHNGLMIQPLMQAVEKNGEYQLVFFDNQFSHATVKPAGFKNSSPLGRTPVAPEALPKNMLMFAKNIMTHLAAKFPRKITRARIDLFAGDKGPILCEVELVEPNTNLNRLDKVEQVSAATQFVKKVILQMNHMEMISRPLLWNKKNTVFSPANTRKTKLTKDHVAPTLKSKL